MAKRKKRDPLRPRRAGPGIRRLYAKVPVMECKGLCDRFCTGLDISVEEQLVAETVGGKAFETNKHETCSMLTEDGRCSIYENRPLICRLWGAAEAMECPHGCRPERLLSTDEALLLLAESMDVGGVAPGLADAQPPEGRTFREQMGYFLRDATPEERKIMQMVMGGQAMIVTKPGTGAIAKEPKR